MSYTLKKQNKCIIMKRCTATTQLTPVCTRTNFYFFIRVINAGARYIATYIYKLYYISICEQYFCWFVCEVISFYDGVRCAAHCYNILLIHFTVHLQFSKNKNHHLQHALH